MNVKQESIQKGVADAFDFWLSQHPISFPEIIGDSMKKAFSEWLEAHSEEIIERIAETQHVHLKQ